MRQPLIIRGARQVGKTFSVLAFGETFPHGCVCLDFEKYPKAHTIFDQDFDIQRIIREIEILLNKKIIPGSTLLFFDEIQHCPKAIMSLRYFYEDMPGLHVIAAGSLLEFVLTDISFPVGRVSFMHLHPLTFYEFLLALEEDLSAQLLLHVDSKISSTTHDKLRQKLREYFFIGGMPLAITAYKTTRSFHESADIHRNIIQAYRDDFGKYAPRADKMCMYDTLSSIARSVGHQIKYAALAPGFSGPTIKKALTLLEQANIITKIKAANPDGLPLGLQAREKRFKALMLDIGLMHHLCGLTMHSEYAKENLLDIYRGAMAEQFVGQELLAHNQDIYYWAREEHASSAEVDFLLEKEGMIIPIEVKSGSAGRLKSMHMFLEKYTTTPYGIVFSDAPDGEIKKQKLTFMPLYYAYALLV